MKNVIITISREYGSGGRQVGLRLASELGYMCYDRAVIEMAAEKSGMSTEFIEGAETKASSSFFYNLAQASFTMHTPILTYDAHPSDKAFFAQAEVIREIAARESAVIIGRCSDYILRDNPDAIHIFLNCDKEVRLRRIVEENGLTEDDAREQMKLVDKGRANYYKNYTGASWGDARRYHLSINTARTGIAGAVAAIKALVLEKQKQI